MLGVRHSRDPAAAERLAILLRRPLDGPGLARLALEHGVLPLLQRHLAALGDGIVPAAIERLLAAEARRCAWRNLQLVGELVEILELFAAHGIEALPYKGPVLAEYVYGGVRRRPFADLDLLLRRRDVLPAKELLLARGFRPDYQLAAAAESAFLASDCELGFSREGEVRVELHWRVLPYRFRRQPGFEELWRRAGTATLAGRRVPALSLEDLFVVLCLHAAKHVWGSLLWLCDLSELLRRQGGEVDWEEAARRAARLGVERRVLVTLLLLRDLLAVEIPPGWARRLAADPAAPRLAAELVGRIVPRPQEPLDLWQHNRLQLRLMERFRDRAHFVRCAFSGKLRPTARDRAWLPLPRPLHCLYAFSRPVRLLREYGFRPLRDLLRGLLGR